MLLSKVFVNNFIPWVHFLQEREHKKQEEYENYLKEKLMVDEITRKIYEEDQK